MGNSLILLVIDSAEVESAVKGHVSLGVFFILNFFLIAEKEESTCD